MQFTEDEITSIINHPYNQPLLQRKGIVDNKKIYKELENNKKVKKKYRTNTVNTKIIELDEEKNNNYNDNDNEKSQEGYNNKTGTNLHKKKNSKKINGNNLVENMNKDNNDKNDNNKSVKKENKSKIKKDIDKFNDEFGCIDNDIAESSIMSKSQEITLDKSSFKNKKRKKDKDNSTSLKNKNTSNNNIISNSPNLNIKNNPINNNDIKSNKDKNNKDELSINHSQSQSNKKLSKKKNTNDTKNEKEQNLLLSSLIHTDPQYKRRKIKIGMNRQCNMYEFTDKYENKINFEEEEYERNDLVQVWSVEKNPLSEEDLNNYLNIARLFWNYKNVHIEEDLCADFFHECEQKMKTKKIPPKLKNKITKLIKELEELIKRGINLNSHYDEMSLRILHLCKYKTNVALLFLYKGLNPFIEEIEEGFKHDIYFFQDEIYSFINNGDFFDSDN